LIEAALRAERLELAQGLAAERLALKPHSKLNLGYLARARPAGIAPSEARTAVRQGNGGRAREMANT
jgi:hypothetical protein